jgi:hypothetical protein
MRILKFLFKYVTSYLKAKFGPRTDFKTYLDRMNTCNDCKWKLEKENLAWCKECFCPTSKMFPDSILWNKCRMKNAECPRKKWNS